MGDLIFVSMQQCASIDGPKTVEVPSGDGEDTYTVSGLFHERIYPRCTCPAYRFGKRVVRFGDRWYPEVCNHITEAEGSVCGWHEQTGEAQTPEQRERHICPRCGGPTVGVLVGV